MILRRFNGKAGREKAPRESIHDRMLRETETVYDDVLKEVRSRGIQSRGGICKAVIPVASLGTRFLPAFKTQPKKMLPLVEKAPAVV